MEGKRDFKGVWIPKEIWLSPVMKGMEKMLWGEINSLDNQFGCVADNEHFIKVLNVKERMVRNYIARLKELGMIDVEINKAKNTRRITIIGKWKRTPDETLKDIESGKKQILDRYKISNDQRELNP